MRAGYVRVKRRFSKRKCSANLTGPAKGEGRGGGEKGRCVSLLQRNLFSLHHGRKLTQKGGKKFDRGVIKNDLRLSKEKSGLELGFGGGKSYFSETDVQPGQFNKTKQGYVRLYLPRGWLLLIIIRDQEPRSKKDVSILRGGRNSIRGAD